MKGNILKVMALILSALLILTAFAGCAKGSEGLQFISNGDGTCAVSGIGSCTDTKVVIPTTSPTGDKVTSIGNSAFYGCESLKRVTIPDSVTSISASAFTRTAYYNKLSNWDRESEASYFGVLYIGNCLIQAIGISGSYAIKPGTKCIADSAFGNCTSLTSITIPKSVTSIRIDAFEGCTSLTRINYNGTIAQWNEITLGVYTVGDTVKIYCTNGIISK